MSPSPELLHLAPGFFGGARSPRRAPVFDVENVNPPGYVRDPAFMAAVRSVSCRQVSASPPVGFEMSSESQQEGKVLRLDKWIPLEVQQRAPSWSGGSRRCGTFCANLKPD